MPILKIEIADDFMSQQERAIEAGHEGNSDEYWPTNADLLRVLRSWSGLVAFEIETEAQTLMVKVVKRDLINEIRHKWKARDICDLTISLVSHGQRVMVLSRL